MNRQSIASKLFEGRIDNPLANAEKYLLSNVSMQFYHALHSDLINYFSGKMGLLATELSISIISDYLERKNIANEYVIRLQRMFHELELKLYAPVDENYQMAIDYSNAQQLIQELNIHFVSGL